MMKYTVKYSTLFKKSFKKCMKRGCSEGKFRKVISICKSPLARMAVPI